MQISFIYCISKEVYGNEGSIPFTRSISLVKFIPRVRLLFDHGVLPVDVVGKLLPGFDGVAASIHRARGVTALTAGGEWIIDRLLPGKISLQFALQWHRRDQRVGLAHPQPLISAKEESLVLVDRAAERRTELVHA